ncbi:MAG: polysialic acid transporter [Deltaproteobacteria bacterium SG8_13]|nr:MAG: polysialic acid transporter [Deltaproteobacteria bacterium SG8_13]
MKNSAPQTIYTPESQLLHPARLLQKMYRDLKNSRELAWRLFVRNLKARYRQTFLGYLWAFLPPILTTLLWVFLNSQKILSVGDTGMPYPVYVMTGILLWQVFVDALNSPLRLVLSSRHMLVKVNFPREALILAGLGEVLFNFLIRIVILIALFLWFQIQLPFTIVFVPFGIMMLITAGITLGLLLVPFGLLYGDIQQGLTLITSLWFFVTPIVYPTPTSLPGNLIAKLNPIAPLLVTTREWMVTGITSQFTVFMAVSCLFFIFIALAWLLYHIAMPHITSRIGA